MTYIFLCVFLGDISIYFCRKGGGLFVGVFVCEGVRVCECLCVCVFVCVCVCV